jgi:hypothetical protein
LRSEFAALKGAIAIRAGGISHIAAQKPGFFNNTFANFMKRPHAKAWGYTNKANFMKRPHAKAWGYTNKARLRRLKFLQAV